MSTSFIDGNRCIICGAIISDTNTKGIGFGCMANVVKPAIKECFREIKGLDLWIAKANHIKAIFLETFNGRKFRNDFKKSFFLSMQTAERISKKQLEIMIHWLAFERIYIDLYRVIEEPMRDKFDPQLECPDLYKEKIAVHRKLYLSGKKDKVHEEI